MKNAKWITLLIIFLGLGKFLFSNNTSIIDVPGSSFLRSCQKAATDEEFFKHFKRDISIRGVIENLSNEHGLLAIERIKKIAPQYLQDLSILSSNDKVGDPIIFEYPQIGHVSPTTLRYFHIAAEIVKYAGSLKGKKILEIGPGYGGQALILSKLFDFDEYVVVDLPEVVELASKYLKANGIEKVKCITFDRLSGEDSYDLVISNFAYSELTKETQSAYIDKAIKKSKSIFMILNNLSEYFDVPLRSIEETIESFVDHGFKIYSKPFLYNKMEVELVFGEK